MALRRARGAVLRLARRRRWATVVGAAMVAPAVWLELGGSSGAWWSDGVGLLLGATGAALLWTGATGGKPDWIDEEQD